MPTVWRGGYVNEDPDAAAYLDAVEVADGQSLEPATRTAVNTFVEGCKADGIWDAIKACCIMAGARTLAGALVPLVGTAPTNFNFVAGDYDRETGLKGDGLGKYLDTNRANNSDPLDSSHLSLYRTDSVNDGNTYWIGTVNGFVINSIGRNGIYSNSSSLVSKSNTDIGLHGISRSDAATVSYVWPGVSSTQSFASISTSSLNSFVFTLNVDGTPSTTLDTAARLSFYSIGEALNLDLLEARVSTLMTDLAAAIP